jgi:hypothetical protein
MNAGSLIVDGAITASKIYSGTTEADRIQANNISAGAITAAKLSTGELITLSAQIKDGTITTAKIGELQVTSAKIENLTAEKIATGNLIVDLGLTTGTLNVSTTGRIFSGKDTFASPVAGWFLGMDGGVPKFRVGNADNSRSITWSGADFVVAGDLFATGNIVNEAVTLPRVAYTKEAWSVGTAWTTVQTLTIDPIGQPVLITFSYGYSRTSASTTLPQVQITEAGVVVYGPSTFKTLDSGETHLFSGSFGRTPTPGSKIYNLQVKLPVGTANITERVLTIVVYKR